MVGCRLPVLPRLTLPAAGEGGDSSTLLDAGQILKESERQFLNDKLLKASRDKIVFVITKWDILNEDEKKEALAYARAQLANLEGFARTGLKRLGGDPS